MRQVSQGPAQAVVVPSVDRLDNATRAELEACPALDATVVLEGLKTQAQQIVHPDGDGRGIDLRTLRLEPAMDIVVGIALHGLQVELAGDLDRGLHAQPVHLDGRELLVDLAERPRETGGREVPGYRPPRAVPRPVAEDVVEVLDALLDDSVGLTGDNLVRPYLVLQILDEVRTEDRPEAAERHRGVEVEAATHDRALGQVVLGQQEHAEGAQAGVAESQLVALVVLPEPTGAASAGRQIDVAPGGFLDPVLLRLPLGEVDQVPRREARGAALADVGDLPAGEKILPRGHGKDLGAIAAVLQHGLDQPFDSPV